MNKLKEEAINIIHEEMGNEFSVDAIEDCSNEKYLLITDKGLFQLKIKEKIFKINETGTSKICMFNISNNKTCSIVNDDGLILVIILDKKNETIE